MCIEMAKDIAGVFDGQVEYLESTYGNSVLDLQANKIDLAFALNPTPKRACTRSPPAALRQRRRSLH
jgi:polar amino acid transport system substrate-binding protein